MTGPVIVGATGGSGTRAVAEALKVAGFFFGNDLNLANDSRAMQAFLRPWARRYVESNYGRGLSAEERASMVSALGDAVARQREGMASKHVGWGWKNPPNIVLLDAYLAAIPGSRFVHLIRDGRDMAFSANRGQLKKFGDLLLSAAEQERPEWEQKLILWARTNLKAARDGGSAGPDRYIRLKFEDLCDDADGTLRQLLDFSGQSGCSLDALRSLIQTPSTVGRWEEHRDRVESLKAPEVGQALSLFGYR